MALNSSQHRKSDKVNR